MEIIAYEMKYAHECTEPCGIACVPFEEKFFAEYKSIYNDCFYAMRKALDIQPYEFLWEYRQIENRAQDIYLLMDQGEIIGSVACYGNEIDDLIVKKEHRRKGYGKRLLLWGMQHIRERSREPITLHVAEWNCDALMLYQKVGFEIVNTIKVR